MHQAFVSFFFPKGGNSLFQGFRHSHVAQMLFTTVLKFNFDHPHNKLVPDGLVVYKLIMSKAFKTETVTDSKESLRHANRKLEESAVALKPDDSYIEHITSFTIHVYGGVNPLNGNHIYKCVSHQVGGISPTAGGAVIDMIRDHTFRMLGASEQRLAPMTTEETLDELGESAIIKTSLDS